MNYKKILENFGLIESVDFNITPSGYEKIAKLRMVDQVIHHDAVAPKMNGETIIEPGIPAYDESIQVPETYYANFPSDSEILEINKNLTIAEVDISLLIEQYLKGKEADRDIENDSINIVNNQIVDWRFSKILCPTRDELYNLVSAVQINQNKEIKLKQIADLEAKITPRRIREAVISGDNSFIASIDSQIAAIRSQL